MNIEHEDDHDSKTVHDLISRWHVETPDSIVIEALGRHPLTYGNLHDQLIEIVGGLNSMGIGRGDRVAVVLPNGPELAITFLAVSAAAACAPLNPACGYKEFEFFLSDLKAEALVCSGELDSPAIRVADELGIKILRLGPSTISIDDSYNLEGEKDAPAMNGGFAGPDDVALVLHTSGTTSRPKLVPLTHSKICASAANIGRSLRLTANDKGLNIMPPFHVHGLIGVVLSSISAGASVVCTPGFIAPKFFDWIRVFQPTWYSATPTMHQALLSRAMKEGPGFGHSLRFVRSSSSALTIKTMLELERLLRIPVIEAYGMTEATHQIASNPLPPGRRRAGTVGIPTGTEVSIIDTEGKILPQGSIGEIVIRGPNIIAGYENNPSDNESSFVNGWFRTGDLGYFDEENYLVIKDRIKEIINRGGEKVSPREIDEALLDHPSIQQVVTFAVPDPRLGEEIGAAIVLRGGASISKWEIQEFLAKKLADFKVPRHVIFLKEIPSGPTSKIQRIGLAEKLGLPVVEKKDMHGARINRPPSNAAERTLHEIWSQVLEINGIGVDDNFFQLGGDSMLAGQIVTKISEQFHVAKPSPVIFLHAPTIEAMAELIKNDRLDLPPASLVAVQPNGENPPLYFVHACEGEVLFFEKLANHLGSDQPFYTLRAQGFDGKYPPHARVEDMASHYLREILAVNPDGPYIIGGAGVGGIVAYEMAQQLKASSGKVLSLILVDTIPPKRPDPTHRGPLYYVDKMTRYLRYDDFPSLEKRLRSRVGHAYTMLAARYQKKYKILINMQRAAIKYEMRRYNGNVVLILPNESYRNARANEWYHYIDGQIEHYTIPGKHLDVFSEPYVGILSKYIRRHIEAIKNEDRLGPMGKT